MQIQKLVYLCDTARLAWKLRVHRQLIRLILASLILGLGVIPNVPNARAEELQQFYNRRGDTGLYCSYDVSDEHDYLYNFGSTYDQALIAMNALKSGDLSIALEILDFFKTQFDRTGTICASYDVDSGYPKESIQRSGEIFWVGLALCHYHASTKDVRYDKFLKKLANKMLELQQKNGRFLGGEGMTWASTEHNIDAHAFYGMVYEITGEDKYLEARDKVQNWLMNTAYNKPQRRFNRGDNDISFATDTHAFGILSLHDVMSSQQITDLVKYVERNSKVGFGYDFTNRKLAISYEWTLQQALVYKLIGEKEKWKAITKAVGEVLEKQHGIPYSSRAIDTTHGWQATEYPAMSSLIWYGFAKAGFNPFVLPGSIDPIVYTNLAGLPSSDN